MLSITHLIIIIIAALIFLGPEKIPQFLKSCGEGIVLFKKTLAAGDKIVRTELDKEEQEEKLEEKKIIKNKTAKKKKIKSKTTEKAKTSAKKIKISVEKKEVSKPIKTTTKTAKKIKQKQTKPQT